MPYDGAFKKSNEMIRVLQLLKNDEILNDFFEGRNLFHLHQFRHSIPKFEKVLTNLQEVSSELQQGFKFSCYLKQVQAYLLTGNHKKASKFLKKSLKYHPEDQVALQFLDLDNRKINPNMIRLN